MCQEVVKSPMVTKHWVEVRVWKRNERHGRYSTFRITPGRAYSDEKKNLRIDLLEKGDQLICEVDFWNRQKRRKPKFLLLVDDIIREGKSAPFRVENGEKFEFRRRIYSIRFESMTRRIGMSAVWADVKSDCAAYLNILLYHPSGASVEQNQGDRTLRAGLGKQPGVDVVPGMVVDGFKPEARIISVEGDRAVISFDPADWPKEEE